MTPEQQLIQQICQLIESGQIDRNPLVEDYAEQFAELCRLANERLLRWGGNSPDSSVEGNRSYP